MNRSFSCYYVEKDAVGNIRGGLSRRAMSELPAGDVLLRVLWTSLNYKDALAARGHPGVVKRFPHVPGVDIAGTVIESRSAEFQVGQTVLACAYDIGSGHWGGWSEYACVPAAWVMPLPTGLSAREAMILGTAGFTAAICVRALQDHAVLPDRGEVLVTGASGGVGSVAVMLLSKLGYHVVAVSGKPSCHDRLRAWGARAVLPRADLEDDASKPLLSGRWAGAVDTVGGRMLSAVVRQILPFGCVAACGVAGGAELPLTVYPFILRGVTLAGIDAAWYPMEARRETWARLGSDWRIEQLPELCVETSLEYLGPEVDAILRGQIAGRVLVRVGADT
jgi:putative YhdH/YhfP family quinone oxidoreductase